MKAFSRFTLQASGKTLNHTWISCISHQLVHDTLLTKFKDIVGYIENVPVTISLYFILVSSAAALLPPVTVEESTDCQIKHSSLIWQRMKVLLKNHLHSQRVFLQIRSNLSEICCIPSETTFFSPYFSIWISSNFCRIKNWWNRQSRNQYWQWQWFFVGITERQWWWGSQWSRCSQLSYNF